MNYFIQKLWCDRKMCSINFIENLQLLMKLNGNLSVSELAKQTNLPQPTLHHILSGTTKKPRRHALETLANFFSISIGQLLGTLPFTSSTIPHKIKEKLQIFTVPLIDWQLLKDWPLIKKNKLYLNEIFIEKKLDQNAFALVMSDSNLEPLIPEKSILIFDCQKMAKDRDFAIVHILKSDIILFNKILIENTNTYIKKDQPNGNAQLIKLTKNDRIVASLVEVRTKF